MYNEIEGDLIKLALEGRFDVICHGVNCFCTMGAGIAPQMAKAFGCDKFPQEHPDLSGEINKLGNIDYVHFSGGCSHNPDKQMWNPIRQQWVEMENNHLSGLTVVNAYTQYGFGRNHENGTEIPLDYGALTLCMRKINHIFKGKHIGLPLIGCGLGGAIWDVNEISDKEFQKLPLGFKDVKTIIKEELKDCQVTIVHFKN